MDQYHEYAELFKKKKIEELNQCADAGTEDYIDVLIGASIGFRDIYFCNYSDKKICDEYRDLFLSLVRLDDKYIEQNKCACIKFKLSDQNKLKFRYFSCKFV